MQTQQVQRIKNYSDRERLEEKAHRSDAWYFFYPDHIKLLIADMNVGDILSLSILPADNLYERSLSEMKELIGKFEFSGKDFQQTHVVFGTRQYTFLPEALFEPSHAKEHLKLVHQLPKRSDVFYERFGDKINVFAAHDIFYNTVKVLLPGCSIHHYATVLPAAFAGLHDRSDKVKIYANLHEGYMDVFHFHGVQLYYHNTFQTEADTDVIYFILSVAEQLKLPAEKWSLVLSGNVSSTGSLQALIKKYIPDVMMMQRPATLIYPAAFREFQEQLYFTEIASLLA